MSGWIKLEKDLLTDPRLVRLSTKLQCNGPPLPAVTALGALAKLWMIADTHIGQNDVLPLGPDEINKLLEIPNFCEKMPVEWLEILDADSVKLPGYHTHNGTIAKERAVTAKRVARHRKRNAPPLPPATLPPLPDLDLDLDLKKDVVLTPSPRSSLALSQEPTLERAKPRKRALSRICPKDWELTNELREWAHHHAPSIDVEMQTQLFREFEFKRPWTDWNAVWRRWISNAKPNGIGSKPSIAALCDWESTEPDPPELLQERENVGH